MSVLKKTVKNGISKHKSAPLLSILLFAVLLLTGCGDLVEIQDRDFVLAIGISYHNKEYQVTYGLPDLSEVTDQTAASEQSRLIRTYQGHSLSEIEQDYNLNSENRLDYRHLQVILLDNSVCSDPRAMKMLLNELNENYDISHNALVYYCDTDVTELMGIAGANGSIGEYLKKLNRNNRIHGLEPAKIGSLFDCISNNRTLFIPSLDYRDNSAAVSGGIFFQENHIVRTVSQADSDYYYIALGKNQETLLRLSAEHLLQLSGIKAKTKYELTAEGPVIRLEISGTAKFLPEQNAAAIYPIEEINTRIRQQIEIQINDLMKTDGIDYLNLYEKSSCKSRQTWIRYENRLVDFIDEAVIVVSVDIHYE